MSSSPSPQSQPADRMAQPWTLVPSLSVSDDQTREIDPESGTWMVATVIEDDDLMFGGKSLSAWYEEDRRQSMGSNNEKGRGRQRKRRPSEGSRHNAHHHKHGKRDGQQ